MSRIKVPRFYLSSLRHTSGTLHQSVHVSVSSSLSVGAPRLLAASEANLDENRPIVCNAAVHADCNVAENILGLCIASTAAIVAHLCFVVFYCVIPCVHDALLFTGSLSADSEKASLTLCLKLAQAREGATIMMARPRLTTRWMRLQILDRTHLRRLSQCG